MANEFKVKKGLIVNGDGGTVVDIQGNSGQLFSVTDSLLGILMSVNDITGIPILQVSSDDTVKMGPYGNPFIVNAIGLSVGTNLVIDSLGNIKFDGTPTTTNQNRGIYWTAYDKEGTTDPSDAAYIRHTTNSGGLDGSVLEISVQNDANDGVNFLVNSTASGVRINGNAVLNAGNYNSYSPTLTGGGASGTWGINITGNAATATEVSRTIAAGSDLNLVSATVADNDFFRIRAGGASNAGYVEIATADDGTEPIYVRQYTGFFGALTRTATLLGGDGNTSFPGTVLAVGDMRAPIFYDSANTAFYVDPASTSNLQGLTVASTITGSISGNAVTANSATSLNSSNFISRTGTSGNYNTDFQNTPAGSVRHQGDDSSATNNPGGTWWFVDNYRHSNSASFWGTQVAWGWEDNANRLATRNVQNGSFGAWVYYLNSSNFNSYSPTLTGGGASGTWGINVTGTAGSETLATVTGRGASTSTSTTLGGGVTLGVRVNSGTYGGSIGGLTLNSVAEIRSAQASNPPALTWHYENLATRHILLNSTGTINVVSPTDENSGVAVFQVSGTSISTSDSRAPIFYDSDNTAFFVDPTSNSRVQAFGIGLQATNGGRLSVTGGHGDSTVRLTAQADQLGSGAQSSMHWWVSEPGVTWNDGGFGYNVTNDAGAPGGFSRPNTSFGQAYMRFTQNGNLIFYNTNTSGTRFVNMELNPDNTVLFNNFATGANSLRAPIFYDSDNTNFYLDPNTTGTSLNIAGQINTTKSSGTLFSIGGVDNFGYNDTAGLGTYIKGTGSTYIYGGGIFFDGSTHRTIWHSGNFNPLALTPNTISLPQNPVGQTYGNGVSITPPCMIFQTVGGDDGWRLYGEAAATNQVRMVFELVDDIEEAYSDTWVFRNKRTYSDFLARNEFQISGTGNAEARSSLRAPIFYDSANTAFYVDPASTSNLQGLIVANTITGNISGNSATTSQRTFSRVRTDGINRGSYGAISISGSENGYSGIDFTAASSTFMVRNTDGLSGILRNNNTWLWYFDEAGALTVGTVPWARITGQPSLITGTGASGQVSYWNGTTTQAGNNGLWWDNGNGRLGINTTSPQARLHVSGTVRIDSTSSGPEQKDPKTVEAVLTNLNNGVLMGEPDIWLQINVNGTNYVFPGYIPFGIS